MVSRGDPMRVLLSTIGSRGDVQPLVALGLQLKVLGHEGRVCVPPDFREWIEDLGIAVTPIGPEVRKFAAARATATHPRTFPTPEQRRQMAEATVAAQFETVTAAAAGCDIIVAASALQIAARSVAEKIGIPYIFVAYSPTVLPSPHHPPPPLPAFPGETPLPPTSDNRELWSRDEARFHSLFGAALNVHRAALGLAPDPMLGAWPGPADDGVLQTGAWFLSDQRPLPRELDTFLASGEPPIYFGFGSTRIPQDTGHVLVHSARALGRRAIVSRGWFEESLVEDQAGCLSIGDANLHALFPRVAAVVHHGGAGTTTAAALAGSPQVVIPDHYDQHYWAQRIEILGIGVAHPPGVPTTDSLVSALKRALRPDIVVRAQAIARTMSRDGTNTAAEKLIACALQ